MHGAPGGRGPISPRRVGLRRNAVDVAAFVLALGALAMFVFAAIGRELRHFNEIAVGLVLITAALICQFTAITGHTIVR